MVKNNCRWAPWSLGGFSLHAQWALPQVLEAVEMLPGNKGSVTSRIILFFSLAS